MALQENILEIFCIILVVNSVNGYDERDKHINSDIISNEIERDDKLSDVFNGVYTECFLHLSYSCLQKKTLLYLKELNNLSEVSVIGDYVKFVKVNITDPDPPTESAIEDNDSEELSLMIDKAIDSFFNNHIMKFSALGRNISVPNAVEGFVGRKKRKGGGGGGGGHDFDGKKKMMMMAMMCMKMKLMMMVPAMMGMMGMMSFKGMMFSMMSFMLSKMMLLMKLLEKKGGGFGGGGGGGDGGWAAGGGGGGGAWMPAGGQDYGGGGYDANGQWQSRSIIDLNRDTEDAKLENKPVISYVVPAVRYVNKLKQIEEFDKVGKNKKLRKKRDIIERLTENFTNNNDYELKSRKKRSIIDTLQNAYAYWINQVLGSGNRRKSNYQRYKIINGIKYVYYPRGIRHKIPQIHANNVKNEEVRPIIIAEEFNKGETVEGAIESRMNRKKFQKIKSSVNDAVDDNPWE